MAGLALTRNIFRHSLNSANLPATSSILKLPVPDNAENKSKRWKEVPLFTIQKVYFHHQNIIQIHIQTGHGILMEALRRSRISASDLNEIKIPDELRRLKNGSIKWLLDVWPQSKKSFSGLTQVQNLLQVQVQDARKVVSKNQRIKTASEEQLYRTLDFLKSKKVAIRRLVKLPLLLTCEPVELEESVKRVKRYLPIRNFQVALSFVNVSELKLRDAAAVWRSEVKRLSEESELIGGEKDVVFENRIDYMAFRLKCPKEDVSDMMSRFNKLMTMPMQEIQMTLTILLEGGIRPEAIVSDPWVFGCNINSVRNRIKIINENGITEFKPWILRAPQRMFELYISRNLTEKKLLGDNKNIRGFLQEKLNCDERTASRVLTKVPSIKTATAIKLNEMIEFLMSEGFTADHIIETPRILAHSVETIGERLQEVTSYNREVKNLQILCRTNKDYRAIVRKMKKEARFKENEKTSPESDIVTS